MKRLIPKFATAAAVSALVALGANGALAQSSMSTSPSMGTPASQAAAPALSNAALMKNPLASEDTSQIYGVSVAGSDGGKIGTVSTVLMDPSNKQIDRLVIAEGGILGVGAHRVALPVDAFRWDAQNHNFVVQKTADDLKAMPEWQQPQLAEAPSGGAPMDTGAGAATGSAAIGAAAAPLPPPNAGGSAGH